MKPPSYTVSLQPRHNESGFLGYHVQISVTSTPAPNDPPVNDSREFLFPGADPTIALVGAWIKVGDILEEFSATADSDTAELLENAEILAGIDPETLRIWQAWFAALPPEDEHEGDLYKN